MYKSEEKNTKICQIKNPPRVLHGEDSLKCIYYVIILPQVSYKRLQSYK